MTQAHHLPACVFVVLCASCGGTAAGAEDTGTCPRAAGDSEPDSCAPTSGLTETGTGVGPDTSATAPDETETGSDTSGSDTSGSDTSGSDTSGSDSTGEPSAEGTRFVIYGRDLVDFEGRLDLHDPDADEWITIEPAPYWTADGTWPLVEPGGQRIAFIAAGGLHVVDAFDPDATLVGPSAFYWFQWSPDGTWLAYEDGGQLQVVAADGGVAPSALGPSYETFAYYLDDRVKFSADGASLAWVGQADGSGRSDVFVTDLDKMSTTELIADIDAGGGFRLDWLDDDTLFFGATDPAYTGIFVVDVGGAPELVTSDVSGAQVRPGGTHALAGCMLYPLGGGPSVSLLPVGALYGTGQLSPSGDHAVCVSESDDGSQALSIAATYGGTIDLVLLTSAVNEYLAYDGWVVLDQGSADDRIVTRYDFDPPHTEHPIADGDIRDVVFEDEPSGGDELAVITVGVENGQATTALHRQHADGENEAPDAMTSDLATEAPIAYGANLVGRPGATQLWYAVVALIATDDPEGGGWIARWWDNHANGDVPPLSPRQVGVIVASP